MYNNLDLNRKHFNSLGYLSHNKFIIGYVRHEVRSPGVEERVSVIKVAKIFSNSNVMHNKCNSSPPPSKEQSLLMALQK